MDEEEDEFYEVDEANKEVIFEREEKQTNKRHSMGIMEKLYKEGDEDIRNEAKELKSILIKKNYAHMGNDKDLLENNLEIQGRKKYDSSNIIITNK